MFGMKKTVILLLVFFVGSLVAPMASAQLEPGGTFRDDDGNVRVVYPSITAEALFHDSMPALRRAARGNGLVTAALIRALVRIAVERHAKLTPVLG